MKPIALNDDQLQTILRAAAPLNPHDRGAYLERVGALLQGQELGDGVVSRVARAAQQEFLRPPTLHLSGKYGRMRNGAS